MKFSQIDRGKRAERHVVLPVPTPEGMQDVPIVLIPLSAAEEAEVLAFADAYARERGVKEPKFSDPLYSIGAQLKTIQLAVRDADGTAGARGAFFASTKEVESLERETLAYLYAMADEWQQECSPSMRNLPDGYLFGAIMKLGAGGPDAEAFFDRCGPGLRRNLLLSMAAQLRSLLAPKSTPTSSTSTDGESAPSAPPSTPAES